MRKTASGRGEELSNRTFERRLGFTRKTVLLLERGELRRRVGRPFNVLDEETDALLSEILRSTGPDVGIPTLRALLPWASRNALERHLSGYRAKHRERRSFISYCLTWSRPGSVWAADLSHPPARVDAGGPALLAVRDLASGYTVAWCPLLRGTAEEVGAAMTRLFRRHSAPLVLKTDNGSCFASRAFQRHLRTFQVAHLRSPRAWPEYNGACEAGIGVLRELTETVAAHRGEFYAWTLEAIDEARERLNERPRPGKRMWTAAELWANRASFNRMRGCFQQEIGIRLANARLRPRDSVWRRSRICRKAIERTLRCFGFLRISKRVVKARTTRPSNSYR